MIKSESQIEDLTNILELPTSSELEAKLDDMEEKRREYVTNQQELRGMQKTYTPLPRPWQHSPKSGGSTKKRDPSPSKSSSSDSSSEADQSGFSTQVAPFVNPLPMYRDKPGRTGDIAKFYSAPNTKYTGRASDHQSLITHQRVYYTQCRIAGLSNTEAYIVLFI